jgi:hypothetical protein
LRLAERNLTGLLLAGGVLVAASLVQEARAKYPLIHLPILVRRYIACRPC